MGKHDVNECGNCGEFLNDDDECTNDLCKYSPFYIGQDD